MSDTTMPATEAAVATRDDERGSYELAFHVLPTVAEGEVPAVFAEVKQLVTDAGGTITTEEAPERFDLAYEIEKALDGKYRKFSSAYFGWVRFTLDAEAVAALTEHVEAQPRLLRYLLIRLTRVEEAHPFYFHEALAEKKVDSVEDVEVTDAPAETAETETAEANETTETKAEVDDSELDEALKKDA